MKKQNTFRFLAVVLSMLAGFTMANAQDKSKTTPSEKEQYYAEQMRKAELKKLTPAQYEQQKMAAVKPQTSQKLLAVKSNFNTVAPAVTPAADQLQQLQLLKAAAADKGLPTAKYDAAILQLTNPKN